MGGKGSFSIQKFMLQIFAIIDDTVIMNFRKILQHNFPKMRGGAGGQRPFGTFPKIHPIWKRAAPLSVHRIGLLKRAPQDKPTCLPFKIVTFLPLK